MKEKPNIDCEKYRQIAQMAKMLVGIGPEKSPIYLFRLYH